MKRLGLSTTLLTGALAAVLLATSAAEAAPRKPRPATKMPPAAAETSDDELEEMRVLAELFLKKGRVDEAIELFDKLRAAKAEDPDLLERLLGACFRSESCKPRRAELLTEAISLSSGRFDLVEQLVDILRSQGRIAEAMATVGPYVDGHPENADGWRLLVQLRLGARDLGRAERELDAASRRHGRAAFADSRRALAQTLLEAREFERSAAQFRQLVDLMPQEPAIYFGLADALGELEQLDEAAAVLERLVAAVPDSLQGWIQLGQTSIYRQDVRRAREALARAQGLPRSTEAQDAAEEEKGLGNLARSLRQLELSQRSSFREDIRWMDLEESLGARSEY